MFGSFGAMLHPPISDPLRRIDFRRKILHHHSLTPARLTWRPGSQAGMFVIKKKDLRISINDF
ncbi:MAG TPA: hypothetical protein PKI01_05040 [Bacteroidales bacterium]|nr:hypothetical protein [Bacteroidales bacterium]